jgi:hypothetical protein
VLLNEWAINGGRQTPLIVHYCEMLGMKVSRIAGLPCMANMIHLHFAATHLLKRCCTATASPFTGHSEMENKKIAGHRPGFGKSCASFASIAMHTLPQLRHDSTAPFVIGNQVRNKHQPAVP